MKFRLKFLKPSQPPPLNGKGRKRPSFFSLLSGLLFIVLLSYLLYIPSKNAILEQGIKVGDVVKEDIIIEKDITVRDEKNTALLRAEAIKRIIPIYEYHAGSGSRTQDMVTRWFNQVRQSRKEYIKYRNPAALDSIKKKIEDDFGMDIPTEDLKSILVSNTFGKLDLNRLLETIQVVYDKRVVTSKIGMRKNRDNQIVVVDTGEESPRISLNTNDIYDLKDVESIVVTFLEEQRLSGSELRTAASIVLDFIDVNLSYSSSLTQEEEARVSALVEPVMIKIKAGQMILGKGEEVKPEDLEIIQLLVEEEKIKGNRLSKFFLILFILSFLSLFGKSFFKIWKSDSVNRQKLYAVTGATLFVSTVIYRISLFLFPLILKNISIIEFNYNIESIYYAIPFGVGALIIAFTFTLQSAVVFSFANSIFGGILCNWNLGIMLYILLGNLAVCYGIEYFQRLKRSPVIKASLFWLFPVNTMLIILFNLAGTIVTFKQILINISMGFVSAILTLIVANFIIPIWESIFNLVTELKLIEIANLNLPIFREMLEKAPGTYHHSQMVASLAESTAPELGISPLLVTAMALYHDIGKIDNPHFFTENHTIYKNPHENFSPRESAKNIINHIPDGLERAEKLKIPEMVKSSIKQHHGNKLVRFFYNKAREMSSIDIDDIDDAAFRYQGEKPQDIQNAIVMLADQVEAASKSLASPTEEEVKNVIQAIISANIEENQFDECEGLTFKALNIIAGNFHQKLSSIYHMRISYPGFNFKEKKEKNSK